MMENNNVLTKIYEEQEVAFRDNNGQSEVRIDEVARFCGWTRIANSGNEVIRWERVNGFLKELGCNPCKSGDFINLEIMFLLIDKSQNIDKYKLKEFIYKEILNKEIILIKKPRFEINFFKQLEMILSELQDKKYNFFYQVYTRDLKYRVDCYIPEAFLVIEYDEEHHQYQKKEDKIRQSYLENLGLTVIRVDKSEESKGIGVVIRTIYNMATGNNLDRRIFDLNGFDFINESNKLECIVREYELFSFHETDMEDC